MTPDFGTKSPLPLRSGKTFKIHAAWPCCKKPSPFVGLPSPGKSAEEQQFHGGRSKALPLKTGLQAAQMVFSSGGIGSVAAGFLGCA
ncbi:MAG TPA: hypothetical protein VIK53_13380 [Verrucomicrobiae bacterium]